MPLIEITSLTQPGVEIFHALTEAQLRNRLEPSKGLFIAECLKVIRIALQAGYEPIAFLCERRHTSGQAADLVAQFPDIPFYTGSRELLASLTGYTLTRGVLCALRRPQPNPLKAVCAHANRLLVIDSVVDATNIGAIFRSATALGMDGVLLTPTSCDPYNRRAVRVSMGTLFQIPWAWVSNPTQDLRTFGFRTAALALAPNALPLNDPILKAQPKLALIMGTEGDGLSHHVVADADYVVRIPMAHGVDSLNVAAASAVACWELKGVSDPKLDGTRIV